MALVTVSDSTLSSIANAIRSKNGLSDTYKPSEMADAISAISGGGGITPTGTINITTNGTHDVTNYASANVNVPTGVTPTGTKQISITENGTTTEDVTNYASAEITVNVPSEEVTLQSKTNINPSTASQTITPDSGYDGLSSVQINAMPTQTLPSSTSASGTGTQKATIGKSTSSQYLNIPTGYNATAQYYNILPMDLQTLNVTENGTYDANTYDLDGFSTVTVNVSGGSGDPVYLTKVLTSSGNITIKQVMDAVQYQMHYTDAIVAIRANGSTAPSTGSYTLNNYWFVFENNVRKSGAHEYKSGKVTPDSIAFYVGGREEDKTMTIVNGVLTSSSTSTSCLGGAGTEIMILEIPFSYSDYMGL